VPRGDATGELTLDDRLLAVLVEGIGAQTGDAFFESLVRSLARAISVQYAFVSEMTRGGSHFRTLALWERDHIAPNVELDLEGTPCRDVLCGRPSFHADRLQELFPHDRILVDWGACSYGGVPMLGAAGRVVGHFAFVHDRPLSERAGARALSVMRIFAERAVAEIDRLRAEQEVRESSARFAGILEGATDAIASFDEKGIVTFLNQAAARMLRVNASEVVGSPIWTFSTERSRQVLQLVLEELARHPDVRVFVGEQERVSFRRADGTTFPSESSVFRSDVGGRTLYTCIFRNLDERREEERELARLRSQRDYLRDELDRLHPFEDLVWRSPSMRTVLEQLERVAGTASTVLVRGETGTGKELVARALHARSPRADRALVKVNCAAIPAGLVESELFGHERGAFTGATERRIGRFEQAQGGTIFLDEVGDLPLDAQAKLLRVLQERELERVGGNRTIQVDVRVIAATHRELQDLVADGRFRSDLYYRLNVVPLVLPPLRERLDDVPLLAHYFVSRLAPRIGRTISGIDDASMKRLLAYPWPGNVRELENVIERALILLPPGQAVLEVPAALLGFGSREGPATVDPQRAAPGAEPLASADLPLEEVQRRHIVATLESTDWRIEGAQGAAHRLGLRPSTLRSRIRKLGIRRAGEADRDR
jgi:PAS domain S-box-containing protein